MKINSLEACFDMVGQVLVSAMFCKKPLRDTSHDLCKFSADLRKEWDEVAEEMEKENKLLFILADYVSCVGAAHNNLQELN
jgi:hypothetical protein